MGGAPDTRRDPPRRPRRGPATAGFTLIEALVAFVILALVMVALQRGTVGSVDASIRARDRIDAGLVARTLLASRTISDLGQPASGRMNGHDWTARFEPVPISAGTAGNTGIHEFRPMRMIVEVRTSERRGGLVRVEQIQSVRSVLRGTP